MTQQAIVIRTLPDGKALVLVRRPTACGGSCGSCESCVYQSELTATARNLIDAKAGQEVTISSKNSRIYSAALLVYILPLVFFILGFLVARLLGAGEGVCIVVSFLFLIPAAIILILTQKGKTEDEEIRFDIIA